MSQDPSRRTAVPPCLRLALVCAVLACCLPAAPAQKLRILEALDDCAKQAFVLRGSMATELRVADDAASAEAAAATQTSPRKEPGTWSGEVEILRAPSGEFVLASLGKDAPFALLVKGERRLLEAELSSAQSGVEDVARVLPGLLDIARLRKWLQRAAARRRLIASKDPQREDGMRYRVRLPVRAVLDEPAEGSDEGSEDADTEDSGSASGDEREPALRRMLVHVDVVMRVDADNRLQDLRIEIHETAPVVALARAWAEATKKVEGDQIARLRLRGETMRQLEASVRRVRVLDLHRQKDESDTTRAALERLEARGSR